MYSNLLSFIIHNLKFIYKIILFPIVFTYSYLYFSENMFLFLISLYSLGLGIKLTTSLAYSVINGLVLTTCWTLDKREEFIDEKY